MITKKCNIPIYFGKFILYIVKTDDEIKQLLNQYNMVEDTGFGAFSIIKRNSNGFTKYILVLRDSEYGYGALAHECLHLAMGVFRHRNIMFISEDNEECLCYLMEWFIEKTKLFTER